MKCGFFGLVLVVSLLGAAACGDDSHHDQDQDPAESGDDGVTYAADGAVIHTRGSSSSIDGGSESPSTPSSHDAGDDEEGDEPSDGGRSGRGNGGRDFDAGGRFGRGDGGVRVGPGPVQLRDAAVREPTDAGRRRRDGGPGNNP